MNVDIFEGLMPVDTLFIHGNLASNVWWRPTIEVLEKRLEKRQQNDDFGNAEPLFRGRLICAEWRGCGLSTPPNDCSELQPAALARD